METRLKNLKFTGDPERKKRNKVQATEARDAANNANIINQGFETATTETAESTFGKMVDKLKGNSNVSVLDSNTPKVDNTFLKTPILEPIRKQ